MKRLFARFDTIRMRVVAGQVVLLAGMLVISVIGVAALRTLGESVSHELGALTRVSETANTLVVTLFDEVRSAEQYLTDRSASALAGFRDAGDRSYQLQRTLRDAPGLSPTDRAMIRRIARLQAEIETWYSLAHAQRDLGRRAAADTAALHVRQPSSELLQVIRAFSAVQRAQVEQAGTLLETSSRERRLWVWTVLVASLIVAVTIGVATIRSIERPLARLETATQRFADGDLRSVTLGSMPIELRALGEAMLRVTTKLRALVSEVVATAERMAGTSNDLSAVSEELAATASQVSTAMVEIAGGAERQVVGLEQSIAAIAAMRSAAEQNRIAGARVADYGASIHQSAERHREDVAAAAAALLDFGKLVERSAEQVEQLDRISQEIYDFVESIKTISSQTNLLALNAAIEAARAGEGGVGFAVVADEVRQLADSSAEAAERVGRVVYSVRGQMGDIAETMTTGRARVSGVESVAQGAVRALDEIVRDVKEIEEAARRVEQEAAATSQAIERTDRELIAAQQAAHAHASSSEQVTAAAEEQGASTEEMAAQASALSAAAARLRSLVREFRL